MESESLPEGAMIVGRSAFGGLRLDGASTLVRKDGEEPVSTRWTAVSGQAQPTPEKLQVPLTVLTRNALKIKFPALLAMEVSDVLDGNGPGEKAPVAVLAAPRPQARRTE